MASLIPPLQTFRLTKFWYALLAWSCKTCSCKFHFTRRDYAMGTGSFATCSPKFVCRCKWNYRERCQRCLLVYNHNLSTTNLYCNIPLNFYYPAIATRLAPFFTFMNFLIIWKAYDEEYRVCTTLNSNRLISDFDNSIKCAELNLITGYVMCKLRIPVTYRTL